MKRLSFVVAVLVVVTAVFVVACGDDDGDVVGRSPTPVAGASITPTGTTATPGVSPWETEPPGETGTPGSTAVVPTPKAPSLDAGVKKIGEGTMSLVLIPGGQFPVDGYGLIQPGTATPPCAAFVFAFSWQVTDPFPPDGNQVTWRITRQDSTNDVGSGADGTTTVGCGQLTAVNTGPGTITLNVWYVQGAIQS